MSNADIKPWFRDDLARLLAGVYLATTVTVRSVEVRFGVVLAFSSIALALGVNPETFLRAEDMQLLKKAQMAVDGG